MRLKHFTRRFGANDDGVISVGGKKYVIDEHGEVEVSAEHGTLMLQGKMWTCISGPGMAPQAKKIQEPPKAAEELKPSEDPFMDIDGELENLTKRDLLNLAAEKNIEGVNAQMSKQSIVDAIKESLK